MDETGPLAAGMEIEAATLPLDPTGVPTWTWCWAAAW